MLLKELFRKSFSERCDDFVRNINKLQFLRQHQPVNAQKKQESKALVVIAGMNVNNDDIMSSKIDNDSPISCIAIPHIKGSRLTSESPLFKK